MYLPENIERLKILSWLRQNSGFDLGTGKFKTPDLFSFLENLLDFSYTQTLYKDDFYYLLCYVKKPLEVLLTNPHTNTKRTHIKKPISLAKEFDVRCALWLAKQPGYTIKDRLKDNKILAVQGYQEVDTTENKLLKRFVKQVLYTALLRQDLKEFAPLFAKMRHWLRSQEASQIQEDQHITPNNILLHHPHYSKIFKAHQQLNRPLELPKLSLKNLLNLEMLMILHFWSDVKILPCVLEIENFNLADCLLDWSLPTANLYSFENIRKTALQILKELSILDSKKTAFYLRKPIKSICIDLFQDSPPALLDGVFKTLPPLTKQKLNGVWINANNARILNLGGCFTLPRALKDYKDQSLEAFKAFLQDFKERFKFASLNYLIPDHVDLLDFRPLKAAIAAHFYASRGLPKSVVSAFKYLKISKPGDTLFIIIKESSDFWVTPLLVETTPEGLRFVRYPTHLVDINNQTDKEALEEALKKSYRKYTKIFKDKILYIPPPEPKELLENMQAVLTLIEAGKSLYRDHLPNLSIEFFDGKYFKNFTLVDESSELEGSLINIKELFILEAHTDTHIFNLNIADKSSPYQLRLITKPQDQGIKCKVELEYRYEDENPYHIRFIPIKNPDLSITANIKEKCFNKEVYPKFPQIQQLEEHFVRKIANLLNYVLVHVPQEAKKGVDRKTGDYYIDLECPSHNPSVVRLWYGYTQNGQIEYFSQCNAKMLEPNTTLMAQVKITPNNNTVVAGYTTKEGQRIRFIETLEDYFKKLGNSFSSIFKNKRPLDQVSKELQEAIHACLNKPQSNVPIKEWIKCVAPLGHLLNSKQQASLTPYFKEVFSIENRDIATFKFLGYYLASTQSQEILEYTLSLQLPHLQTFVIQIALWHVEDFYKLLKQETCQKLLESTLKNMQKSFEKLKGGDDKNLNHLSNSLITLLGLLRTIRLNGYNLLMLQDKLTGDFVNLIDDIAHYCLNNGLEIRCEYKLNLNNLGINIPSEESIQICYIAHLFLNNDEKVAKLSIG
ncbi:hypothetical protein [Helicobacter suis]|uniref:hypothetical protein n=1 Tax=Helicobacter suis TaxID=104628 RepID=UPI0013D2EF7B|nr:hypothetical protein [Helicobacter suis]